MNYVLMHQTVPVAGLDLEPQTGIIRKISEIYAPEHLPVGTPVRKGAADRAFLNEWWTSRAIPSIRDGIAEALERMGLPNTGALLAKGYGLSLSDAYWVCPEGSGLTWERINFFEHPFSEDVGNALLGRAAYREGFDFSCYNPRRGGSEVDICPKFVRQLDWAHGFHISPEGRIDSQWKRESDGISLTLKVPENLNGWIRLESGYSFEDGTHIKPVKSGVYTIRCPHT